MTDDILIGTNATFTVAEAAKATDGLILTNPDSDGEDERANRSLVAYAQESDQ
jgi:hypothetical protein